jgi:hypothetical protein
VYRFWDARELAQQDARELAQKKAVNRAEAQGFKRDSQTSSAGGRAYELTGRCCISVIRSKRWKWKKKTAMKDFIEYLLEGLLRNEHGDVPAPVEISASPEEGILLIRAFLRIKQPELRAAIIDLATRLADLGSSKAPAQK